MPRHPEKEPVWKAESSESYVAVHADWENNADEWASFFITLLVPWDFILSRHLYPLTINGIITCIMMVIILMVMV